MRNLVEVKHMIRDQLFDDLPLPRICFSYFIPEDAGPGMLGDLFEQDKDFLLVEVDIASVGRAGPGRFTQRRAYGSLDLTYYTKDRLDPLGAEKTLEDIADKFQEETVGGVRFKSFTPTGEMRDRGFSAYSGSVPFSFDTQAKS